MTIRSLFALLLLTAISLHPARLFAEEKGTGAFIWNAPQSPSPLPLIKLNAGESRTVSLRHSLLESVKSYGAATVTPPGAVTAAVQGEQLTITGVKSGAAVVTVAVTMEAGGQKQVALAAMVEAMPSHEFTYKPDEGKSPKEVHLAGSFNGWNAGGDPMKKGDDGVFRIKKALPPGKHQYKFVIDGEWTTDPANKNVNESDHGNSVVDVTGEMTGKFDWAALSTAMPGAGTQGGFHAVLTGASKLAPESVAVIVNNQLLEKTAWDYDEKNSAVSLKVPAADWLKENYVTVTGKSDDGKLGGAVFPFVQADAQRSPRDEVIYFAFTDRFLDGDPSLNHPSDDKRIIPSTNYEGGDWAGITKKIEDKYFDNLGVTTIWISPPNKNTQKVEKESVGKGRYFTSYHGYWPISFTETNEQYGSWDDLKKLVATAHEHHIAILLDFVSNHVHEDHPLFKENPKIATPLDLPSGERNIRLYDAHPLTTWFDTFLPDIDYDGNPSAIPTVVDSAINWIRKSDADGFRHDAVKHVSLTFWQTLTNRIDKEFLDKDHRLVFQIGETFSGYPLVAKFVGPDLLTGQFDFPAYFAVEKVLALGNGGMTDLADAIRGAQDNYPPSGIMSPFIGNQDVPRFMAYADGDVPTTMSDNDVKELAYSANAPQVDDPTSYKKLQLAFAYLTALPEPPLLYYGDEIGLTGAGDPDNRRMMVWEKWTADQKATSEMVSKLNHARGKSIALRRGATQILHESAERLVIARVAPGEVVLIALNRKPADQTLALTLPHYWGEAPKLDPIVESGLKAFVKDRSVTIDGGAYAFGMWEMKP